MIAGEVSVPSGTDRAGEFIRKMEDEDIRLLPNPQGFLDQLTLISQYPKEVHLPRFSENRADTENYDQHAAIHVTCLFTNLVHRLLPICTSP
jgi:hypothetical protein